MKICSIENCENKFLANNFCIKHYTRFIRNGSPFIVKSNRGEGDTPEMRFWSKVALTADPERCWLWLGSKSQGYGLFTCKRQYKATHFAWLFTYGIEPKPNFDLLHSCDTPACVNPKHLREGTDADNARDRVERNRQAQGEKFKSAKLTNENVRQIRQMEGKFSQKAIAKQFQISQPIISRIITRQAWSHVE